MQQKVIHQKIQTKLLYILPLTALLIFTILYIVAFVSHTTISTHAEAEVLDDNASSAFTLSSDRSLTVSVSSTNIDLALTPSAEGIFKSTSDTPLTVTVSTNNATGYNLNMTTTTTDLTRTTSLSGQTPVIHTLSGSGSFTADTFETNAWGFSLDGATYQPVTLSRQITQTTKESNSSTTNITFAAKLNNEIPHGEYRSTITFIATTNPLEATFDTAFDAAGKTQVSYNGNNYYKMQDMSGFICSMVATPTDKTSAESTQLIDTRDNSVYWVSKLLDGNCWMTQNLDLNLNSTVALTSDTTDLHSVTSWTPVRSTINSTNKNMSTYPIVIEEWATGWNNDEDTPYSVDAGYKYILPIEKTSAGNGGVTEMPHDIVYNSLEECQNAADNSSDNSFGLVCDGHTSVGNYYNFAAANATNSVSGTLVTINKEDAPNVDLPDSICPKGWRLPEENSDNSRSEFNILLGAKNYNIIDSFNPSGLNTIRKPPLYLMRSGDVNGGVLHYVGAYAHAWSSTISMTNMGFLLRFNSSYYYPAYGNHRYYGFPIRCLARTDLTIKDAVYMQDVTPEMRQNTAIGTTATLKDKRDNQEYTIAKLKDGNIWMTTNLNLAGGTPLYSDTSDVPAANTIASGNPYYTLPASQTITSGTTLNGGFNDDNNSLGYVFNSGNDTDNCKNGCYSYYSYNAATASSGSDITSGDAAYSICPSGWKLPTSRDEITAAKTSSDFYKMAINYGLNPTVVNEDPDSDPRFCDLGGDCSTSNVPHFLRAGNYYGPVFFAGGEHSYYWSSTASNDTDACYMVYTQGHIYSSRSNHRLYGFPIRCLLK